MLTDLASGRAIYQERPLRGDGPVAGYPLRDHGWTHSNSDGELGLGEFVFAEVLREVHAHINSIATKESQ